MNGESREIVASAYGDRSENTSRILWGRVLSAYKEAIVFSDCWRAYQAVIRPSNIALGVKKRGKRLILSVGIIPYGNRYTSYVRRCLYSKWIKTHEIGLKLFIHRYNTELLPIVG